MPEPCAVTIGNFDAVHAGHAELLARARRIVGEAGRVVVLSFDPHPLCVLKPEAAPQRLTTFERRARLLADLGATEVERLDPGSGLLGRSPEEFVRDVIARHRPVAFVEGPDFHFGKDRAGTVDTLAELGRRLGFRAEVVEPVRVALRNQTSAVASSTLVRWLLAHARVRDAALVLARPYELDATTVQGDRRGRTIGFPTANLETEQMLPGDGVYAGELRLDDGRSFAAAINVGSRPTFAGDRRRIEAHLLDVTGSETPWAPIPGLPEYGWASRLTFVAWLRDQVRFDSVHTLREQLTRDCDRARALVPARQPGMAPTP